MSNDSNTAAAEHEAEKTVEMYIPEALANEMLAAVGVPMPDAAGLDHIILHIDHSPIANQDFG